MSLIARAGAVTLAALVMAGCTGAQSSPSRHATPSASTAAGPRVTLVHAEPVMQASDLGDYGAILPSVYVMADGVRHAYFIGFGAERGDQRAFHATSADGLDWTVDEADPFADLGLDLSPPGPIPGSVLQADDGSWLMFLWGTPAPLMRGGVIWRATADSPAGPWTADPEPVLDLGEPGAWDDLGLDFPAVLPTDDGYLMLYGGVANADRDSSRIGMATSPDAVTWTKAADPVVEPDVCGDQAARIATLPRLLPGDEGYVLLYERNRETGLATSADGSTWECAALDPVLSPADVPNSGGIHTVAATVIDGKISLLIESLVGDSGGSELWLGELPLP